MEEKVWQTKGVTEGGAQKTPRRTVGTSPRGSDPRNWGSLISGNIEF